jgi:mycofactocin system glycosyltransferase
MRQARLPDGFGVRIDPKVRTFSDGRVLIGGSPTRMLKLAPTAAAMIGDGYLKVVDSQSAAVARSLLDSGVANPRPMSSPPHQDVTVVIPVRNNTAGLNRLLPALRGLSVIVVDDGSDHPVTPPPVGDERGSVRVLRHDSSRGPAAARNTGLSSATTEFVVFLDSDVVPRSGWLDAMLGHFSDPAVAMVAPRIVALAPDGGAIARYEHARSSLDLGRKEGPVRAGSAVSYVPSAAMLVRRRALDECGGFDDAMHVAEDVDLCWRLHAAGWRLRYEPIAHVAHDHRVSFRTWFGRRMFYGTGAAPLALRHTGQVPPVAMSAWTLVAWLLAATCTRIGLLGAVLTQAVTVIRLRRTFGELDKPTRIALVLAVQGLAGGAWQLASAICRHYWPVTVVAAVLSPRVRRAVIAVAVAEGVADWWTHREPGGLGPIRHVVFKRLDDVAYGAGLWRGAIGERSAAALAPRLNG